MTQDDLTTLWSHQEITRLVQSWMFRDLAQWEALRTLFHQDGTIEVTWFEELFSQFVDASAKMAASDLRTKHTLGVPLVEFDGDRAIAETNIVVVGENRRLDLGAASHGRFYDRLERRQGVWKFVKRACIYDMGTFTSRWASWR